ncbi:MAG: hypothetical protein JXB30_11355 [Anaerolineae bacterium]|nr:hypothetical protein [Anaerolineae bacterium]
MGTGREPCVRQAFELANAGDRDRARDILIQLLNKDRDNFDAWIALAQISENRQEALASMRQALHLRPDDEKASRYLEYLLQEEQDSRAPVKASPWLWGGLAGAFFVFLATVVILLISNPGTQGQPDQLVMVSGAQPVSAQTTDCAALIREALEISDQGCQKIGPNQVCYGHSTVEAQLVPGANARFDQPGNTIPINILESFTASPFDQQKGDWGVGVFKLEANLPGTLPGQLVTMLVFGNTTLQNASGDMQAFYFTSGLGGITCDAVPFDGILVRMAEGVGVSFTANGADVTLAGSSILQAAADDNLAVTVLSGIGTVSAFGEEQSLETGETLTVPLGGENGMNADGPPAPPQTADDIILDSNCTLTGTGCANQSEADPLAEAGNSTTPETDKEPTATSISDKETDDEQLLKDKPTQTQTSLPQVEPIQPTLVFKPTGVTELTKVPEPTNTPAPISDTKPTDIPKPTEVPTKPVEIPKPTEVPEPTHEVKPVEEIEPTKEG